MGSGAVHSVNSSIRQYVGQPFTHARKGARTYTTREALRWHASYQVSISLAINGLAGSGSVHSSVGAAGQPCVHGNMWQAIMKPLR